MTDVDLFGPTPDAELPIVLDVYIGLGLERGYEMQNWSPEEAEPTLRNAEQTPLTLTEGIHWALQLPGSSSQELAS